MWNRLHAGCHGLRLEANGFRGLCEQFFTMHKDKDVRGISRCEAVADCSEAHGLASTSCELRNHLAVSAQLRSDVVNESFLVGAKGHFS
jgi:hypothetical protein